MPNFSIEEISFPDDLTSEGIEQIKSLMQQLLHGRNPYWINRDSLRRTIEQDNVWVYTATLNKKIVGMFLMYLVETTTRRVLFIEELVVDEKHRRQGVALALMEVAIAFARTNKVDCIELNVGKNNEPARKLYFRLGFKDRNNDAFRLTTAKDAF